jgi:hypothetical protein
MNDDEQMCEAVVEGLATEPFRSSEHAYQYDEMSTFTQQDFDRVRAHIEDRADRRRHDLEQQLAKNIALMNLLEEQIAALENELMCEAVVDGLAEDAHVPDPLLLNMYCPKMLERMRNYLQEPLVSPKTP